MMLDKSDFCNPGSFNNFVNRLSWETSPAFKLIDNFFPEDRKKALATWNTARGKNFENSDLNNYCVDVFYDLYYKLASNETIDSLFVVLSAGHHANSTVSSEVKQDLTQVLYNDPSFYNQEVDKLIDQLHEWVPKVDRDKVSDFAKYFS